MNREEFISGLKVYVLKNIPETQELREKILLAHKNYETVFDVAEFYKKYLTDAGYTNVVARMIKNPIMKSMELFGFSADQEINDINFNSAKIKLNTTYYPLKKTKFNRENTNNLNSLHTSYSDVCDLMTGRLSAKEYTPTKFNPSLGSTFMLYFNYQILNGGEQIKFVIHENDLFYNGASTLNDKVVSEENGFKINLDLFNFIDSNFELDVTKEVTEAL